MEESKDPCKDITCKVDSQMLRKDVLSPEEVQKLMACHYDNENPTVRQAFIFCLYCGLRFCNVKDLTFKNVDYANRLLKFEQSKAKEHSASSGVVIPLNDGLLSIIGEAPTDKNCLIFDLSTYESCCKSVKRWVKRAGIDKHISWHLARHSFAVNILNILLSHHPRMLLLFCATATIKSVIQDLSNTVLLNLFYLLLPYLSTIN